MKRVWLLLLCGLLLVTSGCAYAAAQMTEDSYYSLYFPVRDLDTANGGDAIQTVASQLSREDDREESRQLAEELLHQLLDGPGEDTSLRTPFPVGTVLQDLTVEGAHAWVDLSGAYGTLSGIALTMADYCITLTLTQLPEIRTVSITVRGQELAYRETQNFSARDVLLSSTEDVVGTVEVTLYFPDEEGRLAGEQRTLSLYEGDTQAESVVKALREGPENRLLFSLLPEGFDLQAIWMEEDICYVNLSSTMIEGLPDGTNLRLVLNGMTNSLLSLSSVVEVRYLVDGERAEDSSWSMEIPRRTS